MQQVEHKEAVEPSTHLQWILPVRLGNSKQGFSVNIEVKSSTQHPLVPVTSVMAEWGYKLCMDGRKWQG